MNKDTVGRKAEPFEMVIERSKIRELALATKCDHPAFLRDVPPLAPPTFFTTMFGWMNPENDPWSFLDINPNRSVQVSQAYEFPEGPLRAGLHLVAQARVASIERRTGRSGRDADYVDIETDFISDDSVVVRSRLSVAEFVGDLAPAANGANPSQSAAAAADIPADATLHGPLTLEDFVRYEGASAHFNPIHFDPEVAERAGLPAPTAVGMLLAGYMASHAVARCDPHDLRAIWFTFKRRVWKGDSLAVVADVVADGLTTDLDLRCVVPGQGVAVVGGAVFARATGGSTDG
jgi:acyl dehydratase